MTDGNWLSTDSVRARERRQLIRRVNGVAAAD